MMTAGRGGSAARCPALPAGPGILPELQPSLRDPLLLLTDLLNKVCTR